MNAHLGRCVKFTEASNASCRVRDPCLPTPARVTVHLMPFLWAEEMLEYIPCGPTRDGLYLVCYRTPGAEQILTVVGSGRNPEVIRAECDRLNEEQVVERRKVMRDKANAIVKDL